MDVDFMLSWLEFDSDGPEPPVTVHDDSFDVGLRITLVGDQNVGKTSLLKRFKLQKFEVEEQPSVGIHLIMKDVTTVENKIARLKLYDLARTNEKTLSANEKLCFKRSDGIILVYDITNRSSFTNLEKWLTEIKKHTDSTTLILLVGNKCDLKSSRQVTFTEAQEIFKKESQIILYFETSARDDINVTAAFEYIVKRETEDFLNCKKSLQNQNDNCQLQ